MLDLKKSDPALLQLLDAVVSEILAKSRRLQPEDIMVVGAACRDILQSAQGHDFRLRATADVDLGLAIASWTAYDELTEGLARAGDTGIRFRIAGVPADLLPFGPVEDPPGTVTPTTRRESMNVWGFAEVFKNALPLPLRGGSTIRIPTIAGYTALKLAAWLDRSAYDEYKDASDIATAIYWYLESKAVEDRIYETDHGNQLLIEEKLNTSMVSARLMGEDIAATVGHTRISELAERWPGLRSEQLGPSMTVVNAPRWPSAPGDRNELAAAMERGIGLASR